nr:immunoglobulin light chain junction region [Macaca mulatta]
DYYCLSYDSSLNPHWVF